MANYKKKYKKLLKVYKQYQALLPHRDLEIIQEENKRLKEILKINDLLGANPVLN